MALVAIEGVYENGWIELAENPMNVQKAQGVVAFFPAEHNEAEEDSQKEARYAAAERVIARMQTRIDFGGQKFDRTALL